MSRLTLALLAFLIGLVAFAQPGLCPCWLMADIETHHPHPSGDPEADHDHNYFNDLFNAGLAAVATLALIPAQTFIAALTAAQLWRPIAHLITFAPGWASALEPPPPRPSSSFIAR